MSGKLNERAGKEEWETYGSDAQHVYGTTGRNSKMAFHKNVLFYGLSGRRVTYSISKHSNGFP